MTKIGLTLRLLLPEGAVFGPGKARLLELIRSEGSISAAGRRMDMSYKRAWSLVEQMNESFAAPLVASVRGGAKGGGAQVTAFGEDVLALYRALEAQVLASEATAAFGARLRVMSGEK